MKMKMKRTIGVVVIIAAGLLFSSGCTGITNPEAHAGYEGYIVSRPYYLGSGGYVKTLKGPARYGATWRKFIIPIDMRTRTYTEPFEQSSAVLAKDNLRVEFQSHLIVHIDKGGSKQVVELYQAENWYPQVVREVFRTFVRDEIQQYDSLDIKNNISKIGNRILEELQEKYKDTPFIFEAVVVGNIQYPKNVTQAVSDKMAATQTLEKADIEIEIEEKKAEKKIVEAKGIATAQRIINETLTNLYLQHEAIQAQQAMAKSPNHTTVYIPVGTNGIPLVYTMGK